MKKNLNYSKQKPLIFTIVLSILVILFFLFFEYKITKCQFGAPLDDVYIHFQFSKNLAQGNGFSFNAGDPTPGSTSPGWTLLITFFYLFIKDHLLIAKVLSGIFYILSGIASYFLGEEVFKSKKWALLTAVFVVLNGRLAWSALSGMEITLFTFLVILTLLFYFKKKNQYLIALILGIASTIRPEGYLIFAFYFITKTLRSFGSAQDKSFRSHRSTRSFRSFQSLIISILIFLAIIAPYLLFSYNTTGNLLPNTFVAQSIAGASLAFKAKSAALYLFRYCYLLLTDNPILALALPLGIYNLFKSIKKGQGKYLFFILIAIGFPLIASITAPNLRHHGRYIIPLIPFYAIIGLTGTRSIIRKHKPKRLRIRLSLSKSTKILSLLIITSYQIIFLFNWSSTFGWNVKNINDMHVYLGNWAKENTQEDSVIALNDIGAIAYISQREIIDTIGLVSPDVLKVVGGLSKEEREEPLWNYLKEKKPDYLIIMPSWYPEISQKQELEEIYRVKLDRYSIVDGKMVVYKFGDY